MKKDYPVFRKDVLTGKILPRSDLFRIVIKNKTALPGNHLEPGRGIYLCPTALTNKDRLKKRLVRNAPETDFDKLYEEVIEWKTNKK